MHYLSYILCPLILLQCFALVLINGSDSITSSSSRRLQEDGGGGKAGVFRDKPGGGNNPKVFPQRLALETYAQSLVPEKDYNATNWRPLYNSRSATDFFHGYIKKLSLIYKENMAIVNFALVGACDGVSDPTIKGFFNKNDHFRGVFVEPVSLNHKDLVKYLEDSESMDRSYVIRGACTQTCKTPTISIERPLYEEKNASLPHWLRRQIASIVPTHRDHARKEWVIEEVRCLTADEIIQEWSAVMKERTEKADNSIVTIPQSDKPVRKRRLHILKIDVEGHDYDVLMSFLKDEIGDNDLPLLICFEAKSIGPKYPAAKAHMEKRGYIVTPFGQDGFALLRGDMILNNLNSAKDRRKKGRENMREHKASSGTNTPEELVPGTEISAF